MILTRSELIVRQSLSTKYPQSMLYSNNATLPTKIDLSINMTHAPMLPDMPFLEALTVVDDAKHVEQIFILELTSLSVEDTQRENK